MALLDCHGVTKRFGGLVALEDVDLSVGEWEIVGLIGPNGAGKTTLFNCITGFHRPDGGRVLFSGTDITGAGTHERTALGLGRTFQQAGLVPSINVLENLVLAQHARVRYPLAAGLLAAPSARREERELEANAMEILRFLELEHLADSPVQGLPYGIVKLVELGQALAVDPKLLLLDEPSAGMGPEEIEEFGDTVFRLRDELGLTVLLIEHHVPLVVRVSDYLYVLNTGQLLAEGDPHEVTKDPEVVTAYLGEAEEELV